MARGIVHVGASGGGALLKLVNNFLCGVQAASLAEALGVHYQTVGYLERGEYSPSLFLALRIAEYFGVAVEVVFSTSPFKRLGE